MILYNNELHIWYVNTNLEYLDLIHILSNEELNKTKSFKFISDQVDFATAHIILRLLISLYATIKPSEVFFAYNQYGKPYVKNNCNLHFNLSHTYKKAAIAFSRSEIGIDIEFLKKNLDISDMLDICFSDQEKSLLYNLNEEGKLRLFFDLWTRKEALLKAIGVGMLDELEKIDLSNLNLLNSKSKKVNTNNWKIEPLKELGKNYFGNVAYLSSEKLFLRYFEIVPT